MIEILYEILIEMILSLFVIAFKRIYIVVRFMINQFTKKKVTEVKVDDVEAYIKAKNVRVDSGRIKRSIPKARYITTMEHIIPEASWLDASTEPTVIETRLITKIIER